MKIFHTADWHLGKIVQGEHMTEDQAYVLDAFIEDIKKEKPDVVIIAGDLYDRAIPPTEAVQLLDKVLDEIVLDLQIPVLAIGGNHDSPSRLDFGSKRMQEQGLHIIGSFQKEMKPVILEDEFGEVHFHLLPFCEPAVVKHMLEDESIKTHNDAMEKIIQQIQAGMDPHARHVFVGHAFVTPYGEKEENTSESERPLSIGGSEYVDAHHFTAFHYTALGHLHQAHRVMEEKIRYAGSLLKYSLSEQHHKKGYYIVDLSETGEIALEKKMLIPRRDLRLVEGKMADLLELSVSEDYVFVRLLDETPILSPMEKLRSVFPNCMHVERKMPHLENGSLETSNNQRTKMDELELFQSFYKEVTGENVSKDMETLFQETLQTFMEAEREARK